MIGDGALEVNKAIMETQAMAVALRTYAISGSMASDASAALTTTAHAAGLNGRIAYGSGDSTITTIEADGTRARTAFDRTGGPWETLKVVDPAHSPDGRKLAFTGVFGCDGCPLETSRIAVIDADGHDGQPLNLVTATSDLIGLANPTWTADGINVAFEAFSRPNFAAR